MKLKFIYILFFTIFIFSYTATPIFSLNKEILSYWQNLIEDLRYEDFNTKNILNKTYSTLNVKVYNLSFESYGKTRLFGYLSMPAKSGRYPAMLIIHGMGQAIDKPETSIARKGFITLQIHLRGYGRSEGNIRYTRDFPVHGILSKDSWVFRNLVLDASRGIDMLYRIAETDTDNIIIKGTSMGGGLSLIVGAINDKVTHIMSDVAFFCNINKSMNLTNEIPYYRIKEYLLKNNTQRREVFDTIRYYDAMNLAPFIKGKVLITGGSKDIICPVEGLKDVYDRIKSPKNISITGYRVHSYVDKFHSDYQLKWFRKNRN